MAESPVVIVFVDSILQQFPPFSISHAFHHPPVLCMDPNLAILVDGGFYRKRAKYLFGEKGPIDRASELIAYCHAHLSMKDGTNRRNLYRIIYYDSPPYDGAVYHPFLQKNIGLKNTDAYRWSIVFLEQLKAKRKVALRMGQLSDITARYQLTKKAHNAIFRGQRDFSSINEEDFELYIEQKGVDMKIGLDIASMSYKHLVDQIVLISADSDFVPAAKLARREGIDFILDPMHSTIKPELFEHIDSLESPWSQKKPQEKKCDTISEE